jgi:hypothetical protein
MSALALVQQRHHDVFLAAGYDDILDCKRRMLGQKAIATRQNLDAIIPARHCVNDAIEVIRP